MKLGSLFDGSGTCPLAASAVGIKPEWASEIEPFPKAVTQSRFPKMAHLGDITKMDGAEIEPVDVITFGSPCQNLSIAGNRKGLAGEQSSLFLEAVRIIREMRCKTDGKYPQIAIWENVYGAFSSTDGEDFRTVLETLWQICEGADSVPRFEEKRGKQRWPRQGYVVGDSCSLAWRGLDAQFWGVAQRRKRVFVVLDLRGQCAGQILFERKGLLRNFKAVRRKGQTPPSGFETGPIGHDCVAAFNGGAGAKAGGIAFSETISPTLRPGSCGLQAPCIIIEHHPQDCRVSLTEDGVVQTLAGRMGTGGVMSQLSLPLKMWEATNNREYRETEVSNTMLARDYKALRMLVGVPTPIPYTLKIRAGCEGGGKGALIQEDKSATLACGNDQTLFVPAKTEKGEVVYLARKLTPTECASLQGFEKDWCALVPHKDSAEYKMWGNGMAFPCMLYIMEGVQQILSERYLDSILGK